jgi:signal transduction histidine kinase
MVWPLPFRRVLGAFTLILLFALGAVSSGLFAAGSASEYEVKAVMLFNLARFVEWPANAFATSHSPIVIGILGRNPFGDSVERAVQGESVNGRRLIVEYYGTVAEIGPCHILFICANEKPRLAGILSELNGQPTLSVSEIDGFSKLAGGMVRFYMNDHAKVRLRLNLEAARSQGLTISSKLIQVAELDKTSFLWPPPSSSVRFGAGSLFLSLLPVHGQMKHPSLRRRLLAAMLVTSVTALLLAGVSLLVYELFAYKRMMTRDLSTLAKTIAATSTAALVYDDQKVAQQTLSAFKSEPDVVNACIFDNAGHLYATYPAAAPPDLFPNSPGPDGLYFSRLSLAIFEPVSEAGGRLGTLFAREDLHGMYNRFGVYAAVVLLVMAGSAAVAFLLSGFFQRRISQPILDLAAVARQISEKADFSVRARNSSPAEELVLLNNAFNEMLEQIHSRDLSLEQARHILQQHADALETRVAERTRSLEETTRQLYDFCYSIAHDLQAPIRSQAGFARLLIKDFAPQLGPEATGYAQRIADAADRQSRLVTDLLTHVSLGRNEMPMEAVDLADVAEQVCSDLRAEIERQRATVDLSGIRGLVMANPASLNLIVINLFSNALKFVPRDRAPLIKAWTETAGDGFVRFCVQDNGIGIPARHIHKLFAMFQRLHTREEYPGTGIGLAIVKRAAERMQGRVGVESEEGRGSRFWVALRSPHPPA